MTKLETLARAAGWFPTRESHVMFRQSAGVCRHLGESDTYNSDTDSYMSSLLRHADSWSEACKMDKLG